jgi:hypothetical protein
MENLLKKLNQLAQIMRIKNENLFGEITEANLFVKEAIYRQIVDFQEQFNLMPIDFLTISTESGTDENGYECVSFAINHLQQRKPLCFEAIVLNSVAILEFKATKFGKIKIDYSYLFKINEEVINLSNPIAESLDVSQIRLKTIEGIINDFLSFIERSQENEPEKIGFKRYD